MKHIVDASQGENLENQLLGRNLFYMIYGAKSIGIESENWLIL